MRSNGERRNRFFAGPMEPRLQSVLRLGRLKLALHARPRESCRVRVIGF